MRIAVLAGSFPEVSETFVLHQVAGLLAAGHAVDLYAFHPTVTNAQRPASIAASPAFREVQLNLPRGAASSLARTAGLAMRSVVAAPSRALPVVARWLGSPRRASPRVLSAALRIGRERYDIVHAHFGPHGLDAVALRRLGTLDGPILVGFHGWDVNVFGLGRRTDPYTALFAEPDVGFIANSGFLRQRLIARGCPGDRITVLPPAVDTDYFSPSAGRPAGPLRVLSVGRLVPEKGLEFGIRAFAALPRREPGARYTIVGEGPERASLETIARELDVADAVHFAGWRERGELRALYRESDVLLFPSAPAASGAEEAAGIVLLEAQACGLPVVASAAGGVPEMLAPELRAMLTTPRDSGALAARLAALAADPAHARALGGMARTFVREQHDVGRRLRQMLALYDERVRRTAA